ncbi:MAG: hypothetical protein JJT94_12620, partial [Bernardetiaceae bacterium]|nr:hypothetical protein [Bernardetiaceae bacterium]
KHGGEWDSRNNPPGAVMTYGELLSFIDNFEGFFTAVAGIITGGGEKYLSKNKYQTIPRKRLAKDVGGEEALKRETRKLQSKVVKLNRYIRNTEFFRDNLELLESSLVEQKQGLEVKMLDVNTSIDDVADIIERWNKVNNKLEDIDYQINQAEKRINRAKQGLDKLLE